MNKAISSDNYHLSSCDCTKIVNNNIKVLGKGEISIEPDSAEIILGVITENLSLSAAQEENSKVVNQIINSLNEIGISSKYMQTQDYNIRAVYDYIDGKQVF